MGVLGHAGSGGFAYSGAENAITTIEQPVGVCLLNFAIDVARDAGGVLIQRLGAAKISNKGDIDLVTEADVASENLIIERIRSYYPQHGILAEE